jgi:hypothetical protein
MLNDLKIIDIDRIYQFETYSEERAEILAEELTETGKLHHPLLVYPLDGHYLLLDDATILAALRTLKIEQAPIQGADEVLVTIRPWQRILEDCRRDEMLEFCREFPRNISIEENASKPLAPHQAEIRFTEDESVRFTFAGHSAYVRADVCIRFYRYIVNCYKGYRAKIDYHDRQVYAALPESSSVVFLPAFNLKELAGMAGRGFRLPRGMVRVDQPNRILGIDCALDVLRDNVPIEEKELFLQQLLILRMSSERFAYYGGSVFMFNG